MNSFYRYSFANNVVRKEINKRKIAAAIDLQLIVEYRVLYVEIEIEL